MIIPSFFQQALPVLKKLEKSGYEAYFVGGAVRDLFLSRSIHDVDIATSATPLEVKSIFTHTVDVGIDHGTILVLHKGTGFEVTTFRTESAYSDFRRPDHVEFVRSLYDDLKRRDFTMNAMAMDKEGQWIDPFNGKEDIQNGLIRTVGLASERFSEDALRMLRAARFVSQLSFQLEEQTKAAMQQQAQLLEHIAVERKLAELDKLLEGSNKQQALASLIETGLYRFLPGLADRKTALEHFASLSIETLTKEQCWIVLSWLCVKEEVKPFLKGWRFPQKRIQHVERSVKTIGQLKASGADDWLFFQAGREAAVDATAAVASLENRDPDLEQAADRWDALPIKHRQELAISGVDLLQWTNRSRGPWIKEILQQAEQAVVRKNVLNTRHDIERWLRECNLL